MKKLHLKRNILALHFFAVTFNCLSITVPFLVPFWLGNGMTMFEIHLLQGIFAIMLLVLEVPSGYIADLFGRKTTLMIAGFIESIAVLAYGFGYSFLDFLLAEALFAIAHSLVSGAFEAILYDSLLEARLTHKYQKTFGEIRRTGFLFSAFGTLIGGYIGLHDQRILFFIAWLVTLPTLALSFLLVEPKRKKLERKGSHLHEIIRIAKLCFLERKDLAWILLYSGLTIAFLQTAFWSYQPYLKECGVEPKFYGVIFMSLNIVAAMSSTKAHQVFKYLGEVRSYFVIFILLAITYLMIGAWCILPVIPLLLQQLIRGYAFVAFSDAINLHTDSAIRATTLSLQGFVKGLLYTFLVILVGALHSFGLSFAMLSAALLLLLLGGLMLVLGLGSVVN